MRKIWGAAGLAAAALVLTACGSSGSSTTQGSAPAAAAGSSAPSSTAASAPASAAAAGGGVLQSATVGGTKVLTNSKGFVLYWFAPDTPTTSKCSGSCATFWPPVTGTVTAGSGVTGTLGTITRSDGTTQVTYDVHPLYTFAGDKSPMEASGNRLNESGGLWYEMTVSGATPGGASSTASAKAGGGYGY